MYYESYNGIRKKKHNSMMTDDLQVPIQYKCVRLDLVMSRHYVSLVNAL